MNWQKAISQTIKKPAFHLVLLSVLLVFLYSQSTIRLMDDAALYQSFTEKLVNNGVVDFSIPGFHGADFLTAPIYAVTRLPYSVAILDIIAAVANIFLIYLAAKEVFKDKKIGVFAAYIYLLNPLDYSNPLRGHHHTPLMFFILLGLYLLFKKSNFAWLAFGISYVIRPFGIALAPLFWYQKKMKQFFLSLIIPAVYIIAEYWQIGKVYVGVHSDLTPGALFSLKRSVLNLGYAFQNYFSVHNFSFLNALDPTDMIHLSPFITFLALVGILSYKEYFTDKKLFAALFFSSGLALALPALFYHLDMWHLWTFNFTLILLALPVLVRYTKILPIVVASFAFQFLYAYVGFRNVYWHNYAIFVIPIVIFAISLYYTFYQLYFKKK